jgi:hypothetical protein
MTNRFGPIFVDKLDLERRPQVFAAVVIEVKFGRCASLGEDRRLKRHELCQFPQILGGGGQ